ncbi:4'-phosphopantetheine phosphatase-like [Liolophura sinensis]|uniref:4'-phosphopantetheine phosphatase-like n=1 Tax=Liolophura sinensis TaxID=3198878 RepID=UPI00315945A1
MSDTHQEGNANEEVESAAGYSTSIELPSAQVFRNLKNANRFAIDIGGSLAKLAYSSTFQRKTALVSDDVNKNTTSGHIYEISETEETGNRLHFIKFETKFIETCLDFICQNLVDDVNHYGALKEKHVKTTGGGAYKYKDLTVRTQIDKEDEIDLPNQGCNFLLKNIPDEVFLYDRHDTPQYKFQGVEHDIFPYLLVNIGSGVSIIKVEAENQFERIGGTSTGGGTFWGLGSLLTGAKDFDELLELAESGDHRSVDMLVKDIYGGAYTCVGLPGEVIASSFGKAARSCTHQNNHNSKEADCAKSLLLSISNDIGQISCLHAKLHNLKKIYFGGFFIRGHPMTMHTITYAINYWSKGDIQALFLRHEGYLGAIGAFLKGAEEEDGGLYSWGENYAGSSGLQSPQGSAFQFKTRSSTFDMLELDKLSKPLICCPLLLDPASYIPDTVDLTHDREAREYWLQCFSESIERTRCQAVSSQPNSDDVEQRASKFKEKYLSRLQDLKQNPCAYGTLTVRSLLDMVNHCLQEFNFTDPYLQQKQFENDQALKCLPDLLRQHCEMTFEQRQFAISKGLLAGNVFDWGAQEVVQILSENKEFGFLEAQDKLQGRPWLFDDYDHWYERVSQGPPHKCAAIFCDNSGADIILGVMPFTVDLLQRGTQVILCANSRPTLNDVTFTELLILVKRVAAVSDVIRTALDQGHLKVMESGQGSPCLDLRLTDHELVQMMRRQGTDLIVIVGMGRAVHTNCHAAFACDALKVAVLKNRWLANRLGGNMFDVMFKFERSRKVAASAGR